MAMQIQGKDGKCKYLRIYICKYCLWYALNCLQWRLYSAKLRPIKDSATTLRGSLQPCQYLSSSIKIKPNTEMEMQSTLKVQGIVKTKDLWEDFNWNQPNSSLHESLNIYYTSIYIITSLLSIDNIDTAWKSSKGILRELGLCSG